MRPYLLRHPLGLLAVVGLAIADAAWHIFGLHEPVLNIVMKGKP